MAAVAAGCRKALVSAGSAGWAIVSRSQTLAARVWLRETRWAIGLLSCTNGRRKRSFHLVYITIKTFRLLWCTHHEVQGMLPNRP